MQLETVLYHRLGLPSDVISHKTKQIVTIELHLPLFGKEIAVMFYHFITFRNNGCGFLEVDLLFVQ